MKSVSLLVLAAFALVLLAGCAPGPNELVNSLDARGSVPGFWQGLWNGVISPVTFIISLFNAKVQMYEVHNNGTLYNLGFLLGVIVAFGGGAGGAAARRKNR